MTRNASQFELVQRLIIEVRGDPADFLLRWSLHYNYLSVLTRYACKFNEDPGFIVVLHSFGVGLSIKIDAENVVARGTVIG
jgi:hypothetical protein